MNICFMQRTMHFSWSKFYGDGDNPKVLESHVYNGSNSYLNFPDNHKFYIFECIFCFNTDRAVYYQNTDSISQLLVEFSEFYNNSANGNGVNIYYESTGDIVNTRICVHDCEQFNPDEEYSVRGLYAYSYLTAEEAYSFFDIDKVTGYKNYFIDMSISLSNSMKADGGGSLSCSYGELKISKYNCTSLKCKFTTFTYYQYPKNQSDISFVICKNTSCLYSCLESRDFDSFKVTLKYCRFESNNFERYILSMSYGKYYIEKCIFVNNIPMDENYNSLIYADYFEISECYIDEKLSVKDDSDGQIISPIHELYKNLYRFHINACSPDPILPTVIHEDDIHILLILIEKILFIIQ